MSKQVRPDALNGLCAAGSAVAALLLLFAGSVPASADDLGSIRSQIAITASYNFRALPASAGSGIVVAVLSTGVDPAFATVLGSRLHAESVSTLEPTPDDRNNIGTQHISIVAALAPGARILSIKALDKDGRGGFDPVSKAVERAVNLGANIIIFPLGVPASKSDPALTKAITSALGRNVLVVAPAGNSGAGDIACPANMDGVIAVGAVDGKDRVAAFSNRGGKILFAPGVDVNTRIVGGTFKTYKGTSISTTVAGAIFAVLWSQKPAMTAQDLAALVERTSHIIDAGGNPARRIDGEGARAALP